MSDAEAAYGRIETFVRNASEATLGEEPDKDIQRLIKGQAKVFKALARNPETLKSLVSNFNTTAAAFARALREIPVSGGVGGGAHSGWGGGM